QLVRARERLRHPDDPRLRIAVVAGCRADRVRHAAPWLHEPFVEPLSPVPGQRALDERPVERQELLAVSGGRSLDVDMMAGSVPIPVLAEQAVGEVRDGRHGCGASFLFVLAGRLPSAY